MYFGENTEVYRSCSLLWNNEFYVIGGDIQTRQISKLAGCELLSIGKLNFNHTEGGCSVAGNDIYLCFNAENVEDYRKCRRAINPLGSFSEIHRTAYDHRYSRIASSDSKKT